MLIISKNDVTIVNLARSFEAQLVIFMKEARRRRFEVAFERKIRREIDMRLFCLYLSVKFNDVVFFFVYGLADHNRCVNLSIGIEFNGPIA